MTTYTAPHNLPIIEPATDTIRSTTGDNLWKQINALALSAGNAISAEGGRAEDAAKAYTDTEVGKKISRGGAALQLLRNNAGGTTTEWVTPSKALVGLDKVDNTADAAKPVSTAQQSAINAVRATAQAVEARANAGEFNGTDGSNVLPTQEGIKEALLNAGPARDALEATFTKRRLHAPLSSGGTDYSFIRDTSDAPAATFRYEDEAQHLGSIMNLHHRGQGGLGAQAYGLNIANHTGAKSAFVIHQYSNTMAMIRLDNTDDNSAIQIYNTENPTLNPGRIGTGAFLDFKPWAETKRLRLLDSLTWLNETAKNVTFETATAPNYGLGVKVTKDIPALFIHKASAGLGAGIAVTNEGTSPGVDVTQNGVALGLRLTAGPNHTAYIAQLRGQAYGTEASTETDGGTTFSVNKKGTGAGSALVVRNAGTGSSLQFLTGTATVARISYAGEYEHLTAGQGIILKSPNGTRHRITVNDGGAVIATALAS